MPQFADLCIFRKNKERCFLHPNPLKNIFVRDFSSILFVKLCLLVNGHVICLNFGLNRAKRGFIALTIDLLRKYICSTVDYVLVRDDGRHVHRYNFYDRIWFFASS